MDDNFDSCDVIDSDEEQNVLENFEAPDVLFLGESENGAILEAPEETAVFSDENLLNDETGQFALEDTNQIAEIPEGDSLFDNSNVLAGEKEAENDFVATNHILEVPGDNPETNQNNLQSNSPSPESFNDSSEPSLESEPPKPPDSLNEYRTGDVLGLSEQSQSFEKLGQSDRNNARDHDSIQTELSLKEAIKDSKNELTEKKDYEVERMNEKKEGVEHIKCRNEELEGKKHPETGVPFERKQLEVDGKQVEVVVPKFESKYDAHLPEDMLKSPDRVQFKECNSQLKEEIVNNKALREQFDSEQIAHIEKGKTPPGYTWNHDASVGTMQLVNLETHQKTGHTGGRSIWGGGTSNRQ